MADFYLTCKRTLDPDDWRIFNAHYLMGADYRLCARQLGLPCATRNDKKYFFDKCYRMEGVLGRVFRELQPFCLWPCDEYFGQKARHEIIAPTPLKEPARYQPLRPPLAKRPPRAPVAVAPAPAPCEPIATPLCLPPAKAVRLTKAERLAFIRSRLAA